MEDRPWYKHWPRGLPVSIDYPRIPVQRFLESSAKKYPDRAAIIFQPTGEVTTYAGLLEMARRFAAALHRLGVHKGDRVAVQLPNEAHTAAVYYGILIAGAVYVPANPLLSFREMLWVLSNSGAETFVIFENFMDKFLPIRYDTPVKNLIVTGVSEMLPPHVPVDVKQYGPRSYSLVQLLNDTPPDPPHVAIDPGEDLAHIAYTGGTTGVPKGVEVTHQMIVTACLQQVHWNAGGHPVVLEDGTLDVVEPFEPAVRDDWEYPQVIGGEQKALVVVPWAHTMGVNGYLNCLVCVGNVMIVHPRLDLGAYLADIGRHGIMACGGAPQLLVAMLNYPHRDGLDLSSVRVVGSSAAPLPVDVLHGIEKMFPNAIVLEGYGLTETVLAVTLNPPNRSGLRKPGSVGIPQFDCDVKIVDIDDPSVEIGFNEYGEVAVRGPQVMKRYWQNPEETAKVFLDGWLLTGDIGYMDEDGYLFIVDRKKDMLIFNGHNVYPRELEEILFSHRAVANCAVIGKPHSVAGEIPKAFVIPKPEVKVTEQELMDFVAMRVADYKKLRELEFVSELPISSAGKVLRRELRRMEIERMERGEAGPEVRLEPGL